MAATRLDLTVEQGATFSHRLIWHIGTDTGPLKDLTGYTARMQARERYDSTTPRINLTTENGGISLGGNAGTIDLTIAASVTAGYTWTESVYDLELVEGAIVTRLVSGKIICTKEVTR